MVKDSEFLTLVFQSILDEIDVGLHAVDEHGNTIVYNNKMMQIEDMEKQDVLNKNLMDVFMFSKQQDSTLVQALQEGKTIKNVKQSYFNNKGQEITTINHTYPIVQDGNIKGAVEIAKDVTKLERLIRENMHKKEMRLTHLTAFSASVRRFRTSSKTPSGRPARLHRFFSQVKPAREKSCSHKVFITAATDQAARSFLKTVRLCLTAWWKASCSVRKRRVYRCR